MFFLRACVSVTGERLVRELANRECGRFTLRFTPLPVVTAVNLKIAAVSMETFSFHRSRFSRSSALLIAMIAIRGMQFSTANIFIVFQARTTGRP